MEEHGSDKVLSKEAFQSVIHTCNDALDLVGEFRAAPTQHLVELLNLLRQVHQNIPNQNFDGLSDFIQNSEQLLLKMQAVAASTQNIDKLVFIVSKIFYELMGRIEGLKPKEVVKEAGGEAQKDQEKNVKSKAPKPESFLLFERSSVS